MPDTELEVTMWTKLILIAKRAREEPQCQYTSLAHLLDEQFLAACYHRLGRDRASGVDGVTWKEYGEHLDENLRDLVARMKAKRYKPLPAKPAASQGQTLKFKFSEAARTPTNWLPHPNRYQDWKA